MTTKYRIFEYTPEFVKIIILKDLSYNDACRMGVDASFEKHTSVFMEPDPGETEPGTADHIIKITIEKQADIDRIERLKKDGFSILEGGFNYALLRRC